MHRLTPDMQTKRGTSIPGFFPWIFRFFSLEPPIPEPCLQQLPLEPFRNLAFGEKKITFQNMHFGNLHQNLFLSTLCSRKTASCSL